MSIISQTKVRGPFEGLKRGMAGQPYAQELHKSVSYPHAEGIETEVNTLTITAADDTMYNLEIVGTRVEVTSGVGATAAEIAGQLKDAIEADILLNGVCDAEVVGSDLVITAKTVGIPLEIDLLGDANLALVVSPAASGGESIPMGHGVFFKDVTKQEVQKASTGAALFAGIAKFLYANTPRCLNDSENEYIWGHDCVVIRKGLVFVKNASGAANPSDQVWYDPATGNFATSDLGGMIDLSALNIEWHDADVLALDLMVGV